MHTPVADVKVVGTAFNVAEGHGELEVSVSEGKVLVMTDHDSIYLEPGHTGVIRPGLNPINVTATADANTWGYATHNFVFKNTPCGMFCDTSKSRILVVLNYAHGRLETAVLMQRSSATLRRILSGLLPKPLILL